MKKFGGVRGWVVGGCGILAAAVAVSRGADGPIVEKPPQPPAVQPVCEVGFTPIFNGKDLDDWVYGTKGNAMKIGEGYKVDAAQGIVYCTKKDGGNLYTKKEYGNFVLRFEFKVEENGNNGIGIRAPLEGAASYQGMEIQVL